MKAGQILLEAADDQRVVGAASQPMLNLFAHNQIFGVEHLRVDQLETSGANVLRPFRWSASRE